MRVYYIVAMTAGIASVVFTDSQEATDFLTSSANPDRHTYIPNSTGWFDCTNVSGIDIQTLADLQEEAQSDTTVSVTRTGTQTLAEAE